jgi:hypothetical protein
MHRLGWYVVACVAGVGVAVVLARALTGGGADHSDGLAGAVLTPSDLGTGWHVAASGAGSPPQWPWAQDGLCPRYAAGDYPAQLHRQTARDETLVDSAGDSVRQVIEQFQPGWSLRSVSDVRRVLLACASYPGPGGTVSFQTVAADVTGPDSLLVRGSIGEGVDQSVTYFVIARGGPLVTTVQLPAALGEGFARKVAGRVQARLGGS